MTDEIRLVKTFVVDTDVIRAAGEPSSEVASSSLCAKLLDTILDYCHKVIITEDIQREWEEHISRYSSTWLTAMASRGKPVNLVPVRNLPRLLEDVGSSFTDSNIIEDVRKDFPLIEAALSTDRIIISCERRARSHFNEAARDIDELRTIIWVNPISFGEYLTEWLEEGAPDDGEKRLGFLNH